ncbi:MAG TPA: OmpH family outer membrane protein [Halothiobacillaceae bacterium]|nr:OmpH family outer membrane protein [Halothiobacillaceae bacterium]
MFKQTALIAAALALAVSGSAWAKELKVGFVNSAMLIDKAPQAEAARVQLEKEFSARERELVDNQKAALALEQKLSREGAAMSEAERSRQERELNRSMRDLQRQQAEFRDDLNLRKNEELAKLQRTVFQVINEMAKADEYDLILSDGVVYAGPNVDITNKVLERLQSVK